MVTDVLNVRFSEDVDLVLKDSQLVVTNFDHGLFNILAEHGYWTRVYAQSTAEMTRLRQNAEKNLGKQLPDPNLAFRFHLTNAANRDKVIELLKQVPFVERVSTVPVPRNPTPPDYESSQLYLHNGAAGVEAGFIWSSNQNRGAGIKICDIEYAFNPDHTDLPTITVVGDDPEDPFGSTHDHGTAVFGEMASLNNGVGTTGIAAESEYYFAGAFINQEYVLETAIMHAVSALGAGDVILLEQQIEGPNSTGVNQEGLVPVEWNESYYEAIQLAVGQGIIVVEAAGNGGEDLDSPDYSTGNGGHYPFLPGNGSGAIIVGAGAVGLQDVSRAKLWYSNYGACVSVQGNGEGIYTTGYGDLFDIEGFNSIYTDNFGGTSGASPIVTGAVALLQSVYLEETGQLLSGNDILNILLLTGKPQVGSAMAPLSKHIGPLPDLQEAITYLLDHLDTKEWSLDQQLNVFPNPSNGTFSVKTNASADLTGLSLFDLSGKTVNFELQPLAENMVSITLPGAPEGVYFLRLEDTVEKIVLTK